MPAHRHPVSVVFGTAIPTSLYICFLYFHFWGTAFKKSAILQLADMTGFFSVGIDDVVKRTIWREYAMNLLYCGVKMVIVALCMSMYMCD